MDAPRHQQIKNHYLPELPWGRCNVRLSARVGRWWGHRRRRTSKILWKIMAVELFQIFPRRPVLFRQNVSIPRRGGENVIIIHCQELLAKKVNIFLAETPRQEEVLIFDPRNSCYAPNRPHFIRQMVSWEKNPLWLTINSLRQFIKCSVFNFQTPRLVRVSIERVSFPSTIIASFDLDTSD